MPPEIEVVLELDVVEAVVEVVVLGGAGGGGDGSGDVVGPEGAVDGSLALFDGTSGKLLKSGTITAYGKSLVAAADAEAARELLDAEEAGTAAALLVDYPDRDEVADALEFVQPLDADLTAIATLSTTGVARRTGAGTWTLDPATAVGLALLGAADAAAGRAAIGVVIGADVQAYSVELASLAGLGSLGLIARSGSGAHSIVDYSTTPGANRIPMTGGGSTLSSGWIPDLSATYQSLSGKNAASGYAGLDADSLLTPAQIPLPTASAKGGTYARPSASSRWIAPVAATCVSLTNPSPTQNRIYLVPLDLPGTYDKIGCNIVVGGASGSVRHYLYGTGSDGLPGALLWSSGDISAVTTGDRSIAFSGGTWTTAGNAYKDGSSNLVVRPGQLFWVGTQTDVAATLTIRAMPGSSARFVMFQAGNPAANDSISCLYRDVTYASGLPDPFGTPSYGGQVTVPITMLRGL